MSQLEEAGMAFDGVIVAQMAGRQDLMIGAHRDTVFGPVLVIGNGGKYVEALPDVQLLLAPASHRDVLDTLMRLRVSPIFAGVRGEPPMELQSFAAAAVAVGNLIAGDPGVDCIDINPVILANEGVGCLALDAAVFGDR